MRSCALVVRCHPSIRQAIFGLAAVLVLTMVPPANASSHAPGYITFCINVHDFFHIEESADTLLRLVDLFEFYGVRGDFYLTAPITHFYANERPDVIARLRDSGMTISYHVRPPHPAYDGFDSQLRTLSSSALAVTLRNYETSRLDLETGGCIDGESGGMAYLTEVFGRSPVCVSLPSERWRSALLPIWRDMGAQMTVIYHESGTDTQNPFEWRDGLLVRPSDFSVTRWLNPENGNDAFWWNMLSTPLASDDLPVAHLKMELSAWSADRAPFVTVLIHENNFFRQLATPWANVYYEDAQKAIPRVPPFNLGAPDASQPRSVESMADIWIAYEALVAYAAENLIVVTSEDIVQLALDADD